MLREIRIRNLALISRLEIVFGEGLTVLTGETGAGKSIILQAIHLLAGGKADASWVRDGAEAAEIEALFEVSPERDAILVELAEMGFAAETELVIRRIVAVQGRGRFYINGSMATARDAGRIFASLLNVASQHDQQQLLLPRFHLDSIDLIGGLLPERAETGRLYESWSVLRSGWRELRAVGSDRETRMEFLRHQLREIEAAAPLPGEDEELAQERDRLKAADVLVQLGHRCRHVLEEAAAGLAASRRDMEQMAAHDVRLAELSGQVAGASYQVDDQAREVRRYLEGIPTDGSRLETVLARLSQLQGLKRKYGGDLAAVCAHAAALRRELDELDSIEQRIAEIEQQLAGSERELLAAAAHLSGRRREVAVRLQERIGDELRGLCLEDAVFAIDFGDNPEPGIAAMTKTGWDRPEFLFSANPGEPAMPLAKIASGGELSRVMLAIKSLLARQDQVETVVFDEVDAGISGKAAEAVARKIRELSGHHQVICITHLPQIAARADSHFRVVKRVAGGRTETDIALLVTEGRIEELARMLDGDSVTASTLAYARELMTRHGGSAVAESFE